ncbi:MAG: hypothetical protein L3K03_07410 [Thermoplasmata archaeon]|nr:hypothetical protein [Thermoplasmata archaeon]
MPPDLWKPIVAVTVVMVLAVAGLAGLQYLPGSTPATAPPIAPPTRTAPPSIASPATTPPTTASPAASLPTTTQQAPTPPTPDPGNCAPPPPTPEPVAPGWQASYRAGCLDAEGNQEGGSELMHLVAHDGMLFAAVGYWEDTANIYYGGTNSSEGWAQILRLDAPNGQWAVDLTMKGVLRPDSLESVTFTTNGTGEPLRQPVTLLFAAGCVGGLSGDELFTRNDTTGQWATSSIIPGYPGFNCSNVDNRAMALYQDPITGVDRLFISMGGLGIYSGVYDPTAPGEILWGRSSESGPVAVRPLAITEANGNLLFSAGALIYQRMNGPTPSWQVIVNETNLPGGTDINPAVGGIRGLTTIPNPNGSGQSLLFLWNPNNSSRGDVIRLDPNGSGGYTSTIEISLATLAGEFLNTSAYFVLGAYNNFLPVTNPATGATEYVIGMEVSLGKNTKLPTMWGNGSGGLFAGAVYAIRESNGSYSMGEINGKFLAGDPPLVSNRCYAISPFPSDHGDVIYFGGYDANDHLCLNTAWVFSTTLSNALGGSEFV